MVGGSFLLTQEAENRTGRGQARLTQRGRLSSDSPPPARLGHLKVRNFFGQCSSLRPGAQSNTGVCGVGTDTSHQTARTGLTPYKVGIEREIKIDVGGGRAGFG